MSSSIYAPFVVMTLVLASVGSSVVEGQSPPQTASDLTVRRFVENPIITPELSPGIGINIQGPSLIRVPSCIPNPLGKYYLYFADHKGSYIRLAYADELAGPWTVHEPGTLHLEQSHFSTGPAGVPEQVQEEIGLGGWAPGPVVGVPGRLESATKPHLASPRRSRPRKQARDRHALPRLADIRLVPDERVAAIAFINTWGGNPAQITQHLLEGAPNF